MAIRTLCYPWHKHQHEKIFSKRQQRIISLESGEVFYHDLVSATPVPGFRDWSDYASDNELRPAMHAALDQALSQAIRHLQQSFR